MIFFSSDTHFGDESTLISDLRPFKNIKQFDKQVVKTWNKQANKNDTIYVIGDFVDCDGLGHETWKKSIHIVRKIKAQVILIIGNNEERIIKHYFNNSYNDFKKFCLSVGFKEVYKNLTIKLKDTEFYLTHKPADHNPNYMNLYGHTHAAGGIYRSFGINVGCDLHHYRLVSEKDLFHYLNKKEKFWDTSKHLNM